MKTQYAEWLKFLLPLIHPWAHHFNMTAIEAIPKVTALITSLIERIKDRQTASLVQQIQQYQLVIQTGLIESQTENLELKRKILHMEQEHSKAIMERDVEIAKMRDDDSDGFGGIHQVR